MEQTFGKRIDTCVWITESFWCINTTLLINYTVTESFLKCTRIHKRSSLILKEDMIHLDGSKIHGVSGGTLEMKSAEETEKTMDTEWVRCTSSYVLSLRENEAVGWGEWMCLRGPMHSDVLIGRDAWWVTFTKHLLCGGHSAAPSILLSSY